MNNQKKALILGANGYLGRHLVLHLRQQNWQLFRSDIGDAAKDGFDGLHYVQANLASFDKMLSLPLDVDYIYFFTGLTGTSAAFTKYPDFVSSNEITLLNLLKALQETKSKAKIIFPSTRLVYKGVPNTPLAEEAEKEFKTVYAINKFACEQYLQMWGNAFGQAYSIIRICVPYGNLLDSNYSYGTLGFFLNKAAAGEPISLYGDGELRRTFSHVADISRYFEEVALHPNTNGQTYNFGGDNCSLKEVATAIAKKADVPIQYTPFPPLDAAIESGDTIFDSSKLDSLLNFKPKYSVLNWLDSLPKLR